MGLYNRLELRRVAAAHAALDGYAVLMGGLKNNFVALAATVDRAREPSQLVRRKDVDAGLVEDKIGFDAFDETWQCVAEQGQIDAVVGAIRQLHVEIALLFAERVVVLRMHGQRENPRLACKNSCRSIALVDVEIYDQHLLSLLVIYQVLSSNSLVVDHTETLPGIAGSMVRAAGNVECNTRFECFEGTIHGAAGNAQLPLNEPGCLFETDATHFLAAEHTGYETVHVRAVVHSVHGRQFDEFGIEKIGLFGDPFAQELQGEQFIFIHRKAMAFRDRVFENRVKGNREHANGQC